MDILNQRNRAVFGIFKTQTEAESAVDAFKNAGFRVSDISVLVPNAMGSKDFLHTKASKAPEGAVAGGGTGAVIGGALGVLAGIGALAIPGIGPLIAAGPIMAALAGVGVGGAVGAVSGALVGFGMPEYEAKRYEGKVKDGGILLSVHTDDSNWKRKAMDLLERLGAQDISSAGEESGDYKSFTTSTKIDTDKRPLMP